VKEKDKHILTDCQGAVKTAFSREIQSSKTESLINIKKSVATLEERK